MGGLSLGFGLDLPKDFGAIVGIVSQQAMRLIRGHDGYCRRSVDHQGKELLTSNNSDEARSVRKERVNEIKYPSHPRQEAPVF